MVPAAVSADVIDEKYIGFTRYGTLSGLNLEYAGKHGGAWVILGARQSSTGFNVEDDLTIVLGYRRYLENEYNKSNWFGGVVAGDLFGTGAGSRFGIGGEGGYQWLKENVRFTVGGAVVLLEEIKEGEKGDGGVIRSARDMEPKLLVSFGANLRK